jgi:nicotinate dehydrogenase subunit A
MSEITLNVNGSSITVDVEPNTPLLYILRNDLELNGPRFGCGLGQCGACTVIVEGEAYRSCITPVRDVEGVAITTLEGLGTIDNPHPLQQAFIDEQAAQCGYCTNGFLMEAKAFLDFNPNATDAEIRERLAQNLCRCGTHTRIIRAIKRYQEEVQA